MISWCCCIYTAMVQLGTWSAFSTGLAGPPVCPSAPPSCVSALRCCFIASLALCCSAFFLSQYQLHFSLTGHAFAHRSKSDAKSGSWPEPPKFTPLLPETTSATLPSPGAAICAASNSLCLPTSSWVSPFRSSPAGAP